MIPNRTLQWKPWLHLNSHVIQFRSLLVSRFPNVTSYDTSTNSGWTLQAFFYFPSTIQKSTIHVTSCDIFLIYFVGNSPRKPASTCLTNKQKLQKHPSTETSLWTTDRFGESTFGCVQLESSVEWRWPAQYLDLGQFWVILNDRR